MKADNSDTSEQSIELLTALSALSEFNLSNREACAKFRKIFKIEFEKIVDGSLTTVVIQNLLKKDFKILKTASYEDMLLKLEILNENQSSDCVSMLKYIILYDFAHFNVTNILKSNNFRTHISDNRIK